MCEFCSQGRRFDPQQVVTRLSLRDGLHEIGPLQKCIKNRIGDQRWAAFFNTSRELSNGLALRLK